MDQNTNNENEDLEFGIHLDDLTEETPSGETSGEEEATSPPDSDTESTDTPEIAGEPDSEDESADMPESTDEAVSAPPQAETDATSEMFSAIQGIERQLEGLANAFESKIKYDEHKNKVIDGLHQSLQEYRDGLLKKYLQRIFTDVIKIVDDVRKLTAHYQNQPYSEENNAKLLQYLEDMAQELEDMFSWEGVVAFNTQGDVLEPTRQRVVSKIETDDPLKDKTIAQRLRPGYEWDGKVIRPEIVSIYICNRETTPDNKEF